MNQPFAICRACGSRRPPDGSCEAPGCPDPREGLLPPWKRRLLAELVAAREEAGVALAEKRVTEAAWEAAGRGSGALALERAEARLAEARERSEALLLRWWRAMDWVP